VTNPVCFPPMIDWNECQGAELYLLTNMDDWISSAVHVEHGRVLLHVAD
jgi:hypothetical protein